MKQNIENTLENVSIREYTGGNMTKNYYISMFQDSEREFVVTHNADIKPVSYFTGREIELRDLRQRIEEGLKSVLVSGMGGIGKTHICRKLFEEYLNKHAKRENIPFCYIGYIEYNGDIDSSLQHCLKYKEQDNPEQNQEAAWKELEYLAADGRLLLFVDNVNVTMKEDEGLKRLKNIPGAVVLASRRTSFSREFKTYKIDFLDIGQCKDVYEKIRYEDSGIKIPKEEIQDLEYIIEKLAAKHTITIEFLAHLAQTKHWTAKKLRDELEEKGFRLEYRDEEDGLVNIQKSYETLYDLSGLTKAEQNILEAFSVFPYIPLAAETCNEWLLADAEVNEEDNILTCLYRKGWLQFNMEQESYSLHPVFAKFIYEKYKPGAEAHHGLIEACQKYLKIPEGGYVMEFQKYIPFAEDIAEKIDMGESIGQVQFMDRLAFLFKYKGEYKKAEEIYKKALLIRKKVLGKEYPDTAASYNNLALLYYEQGEYKEAEKLYKKALLISEKVLGEGHPDIAISYNNLAGVYKRQGKYKEAEGLYKKALLISGKVLEKENLSIAASYNNFAGLYENQGKYKEAENLYKKALLIREKVLGKKHPSTAISYNNLAGLYESQGKYKKAEELYKEALLIKEKVLGEEHPLTADSYNNLALLYDRQWKSNISLIYYYKAYKIFVFKLGVNHPKTQIVYKNLELAYMEYNPEGDFKQWIEEKMKETEYQ